MAIQARSLYIPTSWQAPLLWRKLNLLMILDTAKSQITKPLYWKKMAFASIHLMIPFDGNLEYMMTMGGVKYNTPKSFNGFCISKKIVSRLKLFKLMCL